VVKQQLKDNSIQLTEFVNFNDSVILFI